MTTHVPICCGLLLLCCLGCKEGSEGGTTQVPNKAQSEYPLEGQEEQSLQEGSLHAKEADEEDSQCVEFSLLHGETRQPSLVHVTFLLSTCEGKPLPGIEAQNFQVLEGGQEIPATKTGLEIRPAPLGLKQVTILLLDLSGSALTEENLEELQACVSGFVSAISPTMSVPVALFDGGEEFQMVKKGADPKEIESSLQSYVVKDRSTNLNGMIEVGLYALDTLAKGYERSGVLFHGNLVLFTDGSDQAQRVSSQKALDLAERSEHSLYSVCLGDEVDKGFHNSFARQGAYFINGKSELQSSFQNVANKLLEGASEALSLSRSSYVLTYCSLRRSGTSFLSVSLKASPSSRLVFEIDASSFEGGCSHTDFPEPSSNSAKKGIWTDSRSGLTWQIVRSRENLAWADAKRYCEELRLDGGGWHLPTIGELRSLVSGCPVNESNGSCRVSDSCTNMSCLCTKAYCASDEIRRCSGCEKGAGPANGCYLPYEIQGQRSWYWSSSLFTAGKFKMPYFLASETAGLDTWSHYDELNVICVK
jgi:hypothetical protein